MIMARNSMCSGADGGRRCTTLIERLAITDTTTVLALTKRSNLLTTALNNDRAAQQAAAMTPCSP